MILREYFLQPLGMSLSDCATLTGIYLADMMEIELGRSMDLDERIRINFVFHLDSSPEFWEDINKQYIVNKLTSYKLTWTRRDIAPGIITQRQKHYLKSKEVPFFRKVQQRFYWAVYSITNGRLCKKKLMVWRHIAYVYNEYFNTQIRKCTEAIKGKNNDKPTKELFPMIPDRELRLPRYD